MPPSSSSDPRPGDGFLETLAETAHRGDRHALEQLLSAAEPRLTRMALAFGASPDDAPDLVQEVLLAAWRRFDDFDPRKGTFLAWIAGGLHGRVSNLRRGAGRRETFLGRFRDESDGEFSLPHGAVEARITLARLVSALSSRQREVVALYELGGLSGKETASLLGIGEAAVRSIARDARGQLKAAARRAERPSSGRRSSGQKRTRRGRMAS